MFDIEKSNCFSGSQNLRKPVGGCITPCGTYVLSGSQDGGVYVWDADTGQEEKIYDKPLGFSAAATSRAGNLGGLPANTVVQAIAYHPQASSIFGPFFGGL